MSIPYWSEIKLGLWAAAVIAAMSYAHHKGAQSVQWKFDAHLALDAKAAQKASEDARKHEQRDAANSAKVAEAYEQGKRDAEAAGKRVADDLRSGAVRLRRMWAGCEAERVSGVAAGAPVTDDPTEGRAGSAGRIIGAADDDAAKIRALQKLLQAERK